MVPSSRQLPPVLADALRKGPFDAALDSAIQVSGLSLDRIRHRLALRGVDVSVTTLSYWRRGRSRPERPRSRQAVRLLEELLELPTDSLVSLIGPRRPRGRWTGRDRAVLETEHLWHGYESLPDLLGDLGPTGDGLTRLAAHDRFELDADGAEASCRTTLVLRAERDRVDRCVIITRGDDPGRLPAVDDVRNARRGRVRTDLDVPLVVTELLLDRILSLGETAVIDYSLRYASSGTRSHECGRAFRAAASLYTLEVSFSPAAVPVRCHHGSGVSASHRLADLKPVWISNSGHAHVVVQDPAPGFQWMRWEWA
ncbi:hypothetical protein ACFWN1_17270 [Streptomyces sp. NPDC058459]|uniref:hypothetical protein n=1 Tax=Streptomyces sp. NPDC058459 TaxID=3346508 RepID=UPI00365220EE